MYHVKPSAARYPNWWECRRVAGLVALAALCVLGVVAGQWLPDVFEQSASAQSLPSVLITGIQSNHSSARVYFQPVAGARDYRAYEVAAPTNVKYAGLAHLIASGTCPGPSCQSHFLVQPDGITPVFPYQVTSGASGGPQVLDVNAMDIEWNGLGDGKPHTLVIEAVDQLGPVPQASLYSGPLTTPRVSPLPAGAMLGGNKGPTLDGNISTNGQGPYTNIPRPIARSQPFVLQANVGTKPVPSRPDATQVFLDTFDNAEGATLRQVARQDATSDTFDNLGSMTYSMNAGTPKEWTIEFRQTDNRNSMPFVSNDHFMDVLFDGATPGIGAPAHTIYGTMSMTPEQTVDMSSNKVLHLTMEVDAHQSFRRWMAFELTPATDPLQRWAPGPGHPVNNTNQALFLEFNEGSCTLDVYSGPASATDRTPVGTAGGAAHGARLWGNSGSVGGAPVICAGTYNPSIFSNNGLGLDDRSRYDVFIAQGHAALFQDGRLVVQSDIPAGSFPWANVPLKIYYSHYLYHSEADQFELKTAALSGDPLCYPENAYWFNDAAAGTSAGATSCNINYPPGYGLPYSDERHWDNMGFEVLPASAMPANADFSVFRDSVQLPPIQAIQGPGGVQSGSNPTPTPTSVPAAPLNLQAAQWANVTPNNVDLVNSLSCGNFGAGTVVADPARLSNLYAQFDCQGVWSSTDFGKTWKGPINTGLGGSAVGDSAGGLAIAPGANGGLPILYSAGIRGAGTGFWRSLDAGVSWTKFAIGPAGSRQDVYPPSVDPYDGNHVVLTAHELNAIYQSMDGGQNWSAVNLDPGMRQSGGTGVLTFINTGDPTTTRATWLWTAQAESTGIGTWRTSNAGASWTRVDGNEHPHGAMQFYQPGSSGVVYMAGVYSAEGWGVLRSADLGQTWSHVGAAGLQTSVFGTPTYVMSMAGSAVPSLEVAAQPGTGVWLPAATPVSMATGAQSATTIWDGSQYVIVTANGQSGLWRFESHASTSFLPAGGGMAPALAPNDGGGHASTSGGAGGGGSRGGSRSSGSGGGAAPTAGGVGVPGGGGLTSQAFSGLPASGPAPLPAEATALPAPPAAATADSASQMPLPTDAPSSAASNVLTAPGMRLVAVVPGGSLENAGLNAQLAPAATDSLPSAPDGFAFGDVAFEIGLRLADSGQAVEELAAPLMLQYTPSTSDLAMAAGDRSRVRLAAWDGHSWVALVCGADSKNVSCSSPHVSLFAVLITPVPQADQDWDVPSGHFFKQANGFGGSGERGFSVTDDEQAAFWSEFQRLGGSDGLGYPISSRFAYRGLVSQAFQKQILQWRPDLGQSVPVNVFDDLSERGADGWLDGWRQTPPPIDGSRDVGLPFDAVVSRHMDLLSGYPSLRDAYLGLPDAVETFGLPMSVKDYGPVVTARLQRGSIQVWKQDTAWSSGYTVIVANGGDIAKEAGLIPRFALAAQAPADSP